MQRFLTFHAGRAGTTVPTAVGLASEAALHETGLSFRGPAPHYGFHEELG